MTNEEKMTETERLEMNQEFFAKEGYRWKPNLKKTHCTLYYKKPNSVDYNATNIIISREDIATHMDKILGEYLKETSQQNITKIDQLASIKKLFKNINKYKKINKELSQLKHFKKELTHD